MTTDFDEQKLLNKQIQDAFINLEASTRLLRDMQMQMLLMLQTKDIPKPQIDALRKDMGEIKKTGDTLTSWLKEQQSTANNIAYGPKTTNFALERIRDVLNSTAQFHQSTYQQYAAIMKSSNEPKTTSESLSKAQAYLQQSITQYSTKNSPRIQEIAQANRVEKPWPMWKKVLCGLAVVVAAPIVIAAIVVAGPVLQTIHELDSTSKTPKPPTQPKPAKISTEVREEARRIATQVLPAAQKSLTAAPTTPPITPPTSQAPLDSPRRPGMK